MGIAALNSHVAGKTHMQVDRLEAQHSLFGKSKMQVMMQNHVLVKTPV